MLLQLLPPIQKAQQSRSGAPEQLSLHLQGPILSINCGIQLYFEEQFTSDCRLFFESLQRGPRQALRLRSARDPRTFFRREDLCINPINHLKHVTHVGHFATSLAYVVLLNQIVHAHFPEQYSDFLADTHYPNIAGGLNPCAHPYSILREVPWEERGVTLQQLTELWSDLTAQLQVELTSYLETEGADLGLSWRAFYKALQSDTEVWGPRPFGPILKASLEL